MQYNTIKQIFDKAYNGARNFCTPNVDDYGKEGDYVWELAWGRGIQSGTKMWGFTILTKEGETTDLSEGGFPTKQLAKAKMWEALGSV